MCSGKGRCRVKGLTGGEEGTELSPYPDLQESAEPSSLRANSTDSQEELLDTRPECGHCLWGCQPWEEWDMKELETGLSHCSKVC